MDKLTKEAISEWDSKFSGIDYAVWMDKKENNKVHKKFKAFVLKWLSKTYKAGLEEGKKKYKWITISDEGLKDGEK